MNVRTAPHYSMNTTSTGLRLQRGHGLLFARTAGGDLSSRCTNSLSKRDYSLPWRDKVHSGTMAWLRWGRG